MTRIRRTRSLPLLLFACGVWIAIVFGTSAVRAAEPSATPGTDGWFEGAPPDASFRVRAPVRLESFAQDDAREAERTESTQGVRGTQPAAFGGTTRYIASCVARKSDTRSATERLDETLTYWAGQGASLRSRRNVRVGEGEGVEFEIADPNKAMRVRLYAPPGRVCTWLAKWDVFAKPREEDIVRFLDSFEPRAR